MKQTERENKRYKTKNKHVKKPEKKRGLLSRGMLKRQPKKKKERIICRENVLSSHLIMKLSIYVVIGIKFNQKTKLKIIVRLHKLSSFYEIVLEIEVQENKKFEGFGNWDHRIFLSIPKSPLVPQLLLYNNE